MRMEFYRFEKKKKENYSIEIFDWQMLDTHLLYVPINSYKKEKAIHRREIIVCIYLHQYGTRIYKYI